MGDNSNPGLPSYEYFVAETKAHFKEDETKHEQIDKHLESTDAKVEDLVKEQNALKLWKEGFTAKIAGAAMAGGIFATVVAEIGKALLGLHK